MECREVAWCCEVCLEATRQRGFLYRFDTEEAGLLRGKSADLAVFEKIVLLFYKVIVFFSYLCLNQ